MVAWLSYASNGIDTLSILIISIRSFIPENLRLTHLSYCVKISPSFLMVSGDSICSRIFLRTELIEDLIPIYCRDFMIDTQDVL